MIETRGITLFDDEEKERKNIKTFIDSFNNEADKQKSKWHATLDFGEFPHIKKRWFIISIVEIQILYTLEDNEFDVVDSHWEKFYKYEEELRPILNKIPQKFIILR